MTIGAAHAIIREAIARLEMEVKEEDAEEKGDQEETQEPLYAFIDAYFEILIEVRYDGLDETEIAKVVGLSSLAFGDWFLPFSEEPCARNASLCTLSSSLKNNMNSYAI